MAVFSKIKALLPSLSSSEEKLANYILSSPTALRDLSSQKLASTVGVSQSSVVKFAQKLEYKGYPALKLAILDDMSNVQTDHQTLHGSIAIDDDYDTMSSKLLQSKIAVLSQTKNLNDRHAISAAVSLLSQANRVLITGLGGSALVGKDFAFKLQKLGIVAISEVDGHAQLAIASTLNERDVVFALSESGLTRETVNVVNEANANKVPVITVTKFGDTPVSINAKVRLYSVAEEAATRISSILARTAQELVIDILFIALMQSSSSSRALLEKSRDVVSQFRNN
ncbi:MurR/RpiR family transcriptional regulator [Glaciecola sp. 2405UD65-10]|uniref:MurR/RpiR family transcriptional regulator n=1 Tax=Glaciecola sp. 2405UD65-10 TaxID=3397244 RepID=UPI003B5A541E